MAPAPSHSAPGIGCQCRAREVTGCRHGQMATVWAGRRQHAQPMHAPQPHLSLRFLLSPARTLVKPLCRCRPTWSLRPGAPTAWRTGWQPGMSAPPAITPTGRGWTPSSRYLSSQQPGHAWLMKRRRPRPHLPFGRPPWRSMRPRWLVWSNEIGAEHECQTCTGACIVSQLANTLSTGCHELRKGVFFPPSFPHQCF